MPAASPPESNPLNEDSKLKDLLNEVNAVETAEGFDQWRKSFLELYTQYLDSSGSEKALQTYSKLSKTSGSLENVVVKLQDLIKNGDLSTSKVSVKARMSMSELKAKLGKIVKELENLLPTTDKEIQSSGFTKWHMGAVLVEEGFTEYAVMMHSRALLKVLRVSALDDVADRQILDEIVYFGKKFDIFVSVMADLGLMSVCEKAAELLHKEMLDEARAAEANAKKLKNEKLSASQHSTGTVKKTKLNTSRFATFDSPKKNTIYESPVRTPQKKQLDKSRFAAFNSPMQVDNSPVRSPTKSPKRTPTKSPKPVSRNPPTKVEPAKIEDDESSYETIEEVKTVFTYETIEREDDSSYETIEEIDQPSEYETDEEEIEVSEYETDTDSDSDDDRKSSSKRNKSKGKDKKKSKDSPKGSKQKKAPGDSSSDEEDEDEDSKKRAGGKSKKGTAPPEQSDEEDGGDDDESDSSKSSDEDLPPPKKYGKTKPWPEQKPNPNHDPYKPTERMKYRKLKHYYHGDPKSLFPFRNRNKKKKPEPEPEPEPPKEKKLRRVVHTETIKTRRKVEKPPKKIRAKKKKPLIKERIRKERKVVTKKRVKKGAVTESPIPKNILIKSENEPGPPEALPIPLTPPAKKEKIKDKKKSKKTPKKSKDKLTVKDKEKKKAKKEKKGKKEPKSPLLTN